MKLGRHVLETDLVDSHDLASREGRWSGPFNTGRVPAFGFLNDNLDLLHVSLNLPLPSVGLMDTLYTLSLELSIGTCNSQQRWLTISSMARNKPERGNQKLSQAGWEALHKRIVEDDTKTVAEHCRDADVSPQRYYVRYPADKKESA